MAKGEIAGRPVPVVGYCMGGTLAVGLAARAGTMATELSHGERRQLEDAGQRSYTRLAAPPEEWLPTGLERVTLKNRV